MTDRTEASPKKGPQFFDQALKQPEFKLMKKKPLENLLEEAIDAIADALEEALPATRASENQDWCAYFWPGYNATTLGAQAKRIAKCRKPNENSDERNIEGGYLLFNPKGGSNYSDRERELAAPIELGFHRYLSDAEDIGLSSNSVGSTHNWLMQDDCNIDILEVKFCKNSISEKSSEEKGETKNKKRFLQLVVDSAKDIRDKIENYKLPPWPKMVGNSNQDAENAIQRYNLWFATFLDNEWRDKFINNNRTRDIESMRRQGEGNLKQGEGNLENSFSRLKYWYSLATENAEDGNREWKSLGTGMLLTSHPLEEESLRIFRRWVISCYWALRALELTLVYRRVGTSDRSRGLQHEMKGFAKSFIRILDFPVHDFGLNLDVCGSRVLQRVEIEDREGHNRPSLCLIPGDRRLYASMIAPLIPYFENPVETLSRFVTGNLKSSMPLDELLRTIVTMCYWSSLEETHRENFLGVNYVNIKEAILSWLYEGWEKEKLFELPEVEAERDLPIEVIDKTPWNKKFCSAEAGPLLHAFVPLVRNALKHWHSGNNSKTTVVIEDNDADTQSLQIRFDSELMAKGLNAEKGHGESKNEDYGAADAIRAVLSWRENSAVELKCFKFKKNEQKKSIHRSVVTVNLRSLCGQ